MRRHQPLTALRAFEAVGRLRSIAAAAAELHVTRPAVSKQVALLESTLGVALLTRSGNAIGLTPAGAELVDGLRRAFDLLSATTDAVRRHAHEGQRLRILVCRDFASSWLASRVGAFLVENPGISVEITAERNASFRLHEDFAFRIFYATAGKHSGTGLAEDELCRWIDMPVCTPAFARRYLGKGRRPSEAPYLIDANYDVWDEWCSLTGSDGGGPRTHTTIFNETTLCLSVATSGGGLTIGDSFLTLPAIISGELTVPYPVGLESAQAYFMYTPQPRRPSAAARKFEAWLKGAVEAYQASVLRELSMRRIRVMSRNEMLPR